ncbi:hypothetical protein D915_005236 [Fasciola hepatica]|uniref:Uncharacterized protein n=1 Tax=Fasciola hepatica TaxID=6192 RepID=A0A4E0RC46_FASHE|nr:hypothetical protein D915_005236 [Fasciola hepatica]
MLIEKRSTPVDGETEGSGLTSPVFTMRNLSDIGLSDAEMMHTNVPINTQFPWQNTDVNREQSPARRPRDTSLTRTGHLLSCAPESVSRESSQDRQISKRRRALEQVASMSIRGARRSTEMLGSPALIYPITRRRHTVRAGDSTRGNLADAIYATVRRRRQLTGPTENPLGQNRSARSPGSARAAGRRREILSINDGLTPKPQSEQNSVSDSAPDDSSPPTPTNVSVSSS